MSGELNTLTQALMERDKRILALEAEMERMKKQMCQFCKALDKKAGITQVCAADCEWRERKRKNERDRKSNKDNRTH